MSCLSQFDPLQVNLALVHLIVAQVAIAAAQLTALVHATNAFNNRTIALLHTSVHVLAFL